MTVFVDDLFDCVWTKKWPYSRACHMICDGPRQELDRMARRIGLHETRFKGKQISPTGYAYYLTTHKRNLALKYGAKELTRTQFATLVKRRTNETPNVSASDA